jgi:hypothetical protein
MILYNNEQIAHNLHSQQGNNVERERERERERDSKIGRESNTKPLIHKLLFFPLEGSAALFECTCVRRGRGRSTWNAYIFTIIGKICLLVC